MIQTILKEYIIHINFINSPGLGYKILHCTEQYGIDKIAMEVVPGQGMALHIQCADYSQVEAFIAKLHSMPEITSVTFLEQMPYKEKEIELATILNSVSEGIIAINKEAHISHINEVACHILALAKEQAIGAPLHAVLKTALDLARTVNAGHSFRLQECTIKRRSKSIRFLLSSIPIYNSHKRIIGAVITLQDFKQVEKAILASDALANRKTFADIVHQSPQMAQLVSLARTVATSSSTVLLQGESGSGKEMFAQALHTEGRGGSQPFIPVNCSALTDTLLESELFGYEEGAFTGAVKGGKKGLFEQADGGTLFLDEIGDISPRLQVQLLRVLQEGSIRRIGSHTEIPVDVRIIAATNKDLEQMVQDKQFREDLYYRLHVIPIAIPPLRERREDIPLIAQHLIQKICRKLQKPLIHLAPASLPLLTSQSWPGNVRQMENMLERIVNLIDTPDIQPEHITACLGTKDVPKAETALRATNSETFAFEISLESGWPPLAEIVANLEQQVIEKVWEKHPSSRLTGQVLGVSNTTILNKLNAYKRKS